MERPALLIIRGCLSVWWGRFLYVVYNFHRFLPPLDCVAEVNLGEVPSQGKLSLVPPRSHLPLRKFDTLPAGQDHARAHMHNAVQQ